MPRLAWDIGYRDQACWVMYERRPDGSILVLDTGEVEETMSDFKVGDVVQCSRQDCPCPRKPAPIDRITGKWLETEYGSYLAEEIKLVSRPSEAKPAFFKKGDRVLTEGGVNGTISGVYDTRGYWVRMDGDNQSGDMYWLTECLKPIPPTSAPALKVGDRVRVIQRPGKDSFSSWVGTIGTIFEWHEPTKTWGIRHEAGKVHGREWSGWSADSLELLPPEPAKQEMGSWAVLSHEQFTRKFTRPADHYWPCGDQTCLMCWPKPTDFNPLPGPPNNGWMPAGTYMPIKVDDVKPIYFPRPNLRPQQQRNGLFLPRDIRDGNTSTLATKTLPKPRFPERTRLTTRSWDPGYGDLEDA